MLKLSYFFYECFLSITGKPSRIFSSSNVCFNVSSNFHLYHTHRSFFIQLPNILRLMLLFVVRVTHNKLYLMLFLLCYVMLCFVILSHLISSHPIPSHLISSHLISSHPIPFNPITSHFISSHLISSHLILTYFISVLINVTEKCNLALFELETYLILSYLILSYLILSHPIPSHPFPSNFISVLLM